MADTWHMHIALRRGDGSLGGEPHPLSHDDVRKVFDGLDLTGRDELRFAVNGDIPWGGSCDDQGWIVLFRCVGRDQEECLKMFALASTVMDHRQVKEAEGWMAAMKVMMTP